MKQKIIVLLIAALFAGNLFAQGLNEFIIGKDYNSQEVFHKSNGCTPDDGVIVFNTTIPNLKFSMVDTPKRLKNVSVFDAKNNCYVLCIQPTDKNIGGITKYSIDITAEGYKREIIDISEVRATETQYFAVKSKKDVLQELDELKQRLANLENKAVPQSNTVDIGVSKKIDSQPKEVETLKSTTVNSINEGQATKVAFDLSILFKTGFTSLTSATEKSLTKLANDLKANPNTTVGIYGYTDSKENSSIKSKKRADAAKEYLIKQGVSSSRIVTDGFGSSNPIADNNTRKGREQNRRVEIYILPTEKKLIQEDQIATLKQEVSENKVAFDLSILFDSNFFKTLTSATKKSLTKLANDLKANPNTRVEIYGYTDSKERSNIKLSQNRANTARDYLIEQGVSSSRIVTDGFGSSNPIADNNTRKGREQNRRVEIYILPTEKKLIQEAQVATLKQESVLENKVTFDLSILFESDFTILTRAAQKLLTNLANDLKANSNANVEIYGYTDSKERSNIKLSKKRADAAKKYLIKQGVSSSRIVTDGFGSSNPIADNNMKEGREQNRRVEIYILPKN